MAAPDIDTLAAVVLAQDTDYHTRHASVFEQIRNYVWYSYRAASADDDPNWTFPPTDVAGLGAAIYAAFVAAGVTAGVGGVAYYLEQLGNQVLTYPYTRASNNVLDCPTP